MIRSPQKRWLSIAEKAVTAGSREALRRFDAANVAAYRFKAHHEIVTEADRASNRAIIRTLARLTPRIPVLSEEGGTITAPKALHTDLCWVLDPIDGTTNYAIRLPLWGVSLALIRDGEPILGVIMLPALRQRYHAILNEGAWMNGRRLHASQTKTLSDATGFLCYGYRPEEQRSGLRAVASLSPVSRVTRRLGAAVLEAAWVASGRADYAILHGIKPWDVAAGSLLVREAGGNVTRPDGKLWRLGDPDIVFSAPGTTKAVTKRLRSTQSS